MRISFLPPPLDGTISLGIYDAKGKLVRVLHREADINEFTIGTDALSTTWDGKNDAGRMFRPENTARMDSLWVISKAKASDSSLTIS